MKKRKDKSARWRNQTKLKPIIVTTIHRGVFFGYGIPSDAKTIVLEKCKMCVYWSAELKGIGGLATSGPSKSCKIGPAVPRMTLQDVTSVMEVSTEAETNWNKEIWAA